MTSDEQLDQQLRRIAGAAAPGPSIRDDVMRRIEVQPAPVRVEKRRALRHLKWIVPVAAAAGVILGVGLRPERDPREEGNGIVWADVTRVFSQARTAFIEGTEIVDGEVIGIGRAHLRAPDTARLDEFEPDGKTPRGANTLWVGDQITTWNSTTGLYWTRPAVPGRDGSNQVALFLQVMGMPFRASETVQTEGLTLRLEHRGERDYDGRRYLRYAVVTGVPDTANSVLFDLWLDPTTREVRMYHQVFPGEAKRESVARITLDPQFPDDPFRVPTGLKNVEAGIWPRLDPEVRAVAEKYYAARDRIDRCRAVVTYGRKWPRFREVRDGERWRLDRLNLTTMVRERDKYNFTGRDQPFEEVWTQIDDPTRLLESVLMPYEGGLAFAGYNFAGPSKKMSLWVREAGDVSRAVPEKHLAELGWPAWMDEELLAPHGWMIAMEPLDYELLPPDPKRPKVIRVRGTRASPVDGWYEYWIDPTRGHLCVRREERSFVQHEDEPEKAWHVYVRTLTETARTPEGLWYPKKIVFQRGRLEDGALKLDPERKRSVEVRLDTAGEIDERFLDWPEGAPALATPPPPLARWQLEARRPPPK